MLDNSDKQPDDASSFLFEKELQKLQTQNKRMFRRHFIFWCIRWTIGFLATAWFVNQFPQHLWLWGITIGFGGLSLLVMLIGNRLITKKMQKTYEKLSNPYTEEDSHS
tara:strand:- start:353 stop:676 length:324 start_codon:yes stop_codon:yes gene_type:complete